MQAVYLIYQQSAPCYFPSEIGFNQFAQNSGVVERIIELVAYTLISKHYGDASSTALGADKRKAMLECAD